MRKTRFMALLLAGLCSSPACAQNLVQNPGFKTGLAPWLALGSATLTQTIAG